MGNKPFKHTHDLTPTEGERSLHYWFSIVLIQCVVQLPLCDLKQCTLVCKSISKLVRDYIQRNFWFQQHNPYWYDFISKNEPEKRYLWYSPCHFTNVKNISTLPINTTKIKFFPTLKFNSPFTFPLHLQQKVTHITFSGLFNQPIGCGIKSEINNLSLTLTHLTLSTYFNKSVDDLPPNLTFLSCGYHFNHRVDSLPPKLTHLTLSEHFNNSVDSLPPKLTHLTLSEWFDRPVNKLPLSLTHLTFTEFNAVIFFRPLSQLQRNIESNLEYLILSQDFVYRYEYIIPPNFISIGESEEFKHHIVYKRQQQKKIE